MNSWKHNIVMMSITLCLLALIVVAGCGGGKAVISHVLPENVKAYPPRTVAIVTLDSQSHLTTALRALGIPFHRIPIDSLIRFDRYAIPMVIVDENVLDDERVAGAYLVFLEQVRKQPRTLILLHQNPETMQKLVSRTMTLVPRPVEYNLHLVFPHPGHTALTTPNAITQEDLDSLSPRTHQLAHGGYGARAIVAANLQSPDSSAALLLAQSGQGVYWYLGVPILSRAAVGYPTEQKLLANLLSYDGTGWRERW